MKVVGAISVRLVITVICLQIPAGAAVAEVIAPTVTNDVASTLLTTPANKRLRMVFLSSSVWRQPYRLEKNSHEWVIDVNNFSHLFFVIKALKPLSYRNFRTFRDIC